MSQVAAGLCMASCSGRGTCLLVGGVYSCICDLGYSGAACNVTSVAVVTTPAPLLCACSCIVPWLLFLFALALLGVVGYAWYKAYCQLHVVVPLVPKASKDKKKKKNQKKNTGRVLEV